MKTIYYYETTDDGGITWWLGKPSFSLLNCVDMASKCCYPYRITKSDLKEQTSFVSEEEISDALKQLRILEKIFE